MQKIMLFYIDKCRTFLLRCKRFFLFSQVFNVSDVYNFFLNVFFTAVPFSTSPNATALYLAKYGNNIKSHLWQTGMPNTA